MDEIKIKKMKKLQYQMNELGRTRELAGGQEIDINQRVKSFLAK